MSNKPPMFDDDDLPSWLQEGGQSAPKETTPPPSNESTPSRGGFPDNFNWWDPQTLSMRNQKPNPELGSNATTPSNASLPDDFNWFGDSDPVENLLSELNAGDDLVDNGVETLQITDSDDMRGRDPGVVDAAEAMPWLRNQGGAADQVESMQMFGWELDSPVPDLSSDDGLATPLPWMAEARTPPSRPLQPAEDDLLGDLFADLGAAESATPPTPQVPAAIPPTNRPSTSSFDAPTQHDAPRRTIPKSAPLSPPPASASIPSASTSTPLDDWFATMGVEAGSADSADPAADMPAPEDYMPDWLLAGQVPTSPPPVPSNPDIDVDALASLFDSSANALDAKPSSRDANKTGPMPDSPPPTTQASDEEEVPAWLRGMDLDAPANRTPISMPSQPSAKRQTTNVPPPVNPAAASGPEFGWLNNLDASTPADLSESAARQAAELDWMAGSAMGGPASNVPTPPSAEDSSASVELDIDALLKSGTPSIDNLLSMSEIKRPPAPVTDPSAMPAPEFDSGLFDPTPPMSTTSSMSLSGSKLSRPKKETPIDDLDSLFADAVLDDNVFDRSEAALKDLQKVELQGETSMLDMGADFGATGVLTPPPSTPTAEVDHSPASTTKLLSRKDTMRPPPAQTPATPPNALRGFDAPGEVLPEWVADLRPAEAPVTLNIGDQVIKVKEDPIGQLPEQIRNLRERAKEYRVVETKQSAALEGPLAGITGAITPIAPQSMTAAPSTSIAKRMGTGMDALSERVKMLQSLLNLEHEVSERRKLEEAQREAAEAGEAGIAIKAAPRQRLSIKVDRLLITLLLVVALILPFVLRSTSILPSLDSVAARADTTDGRYRRLSDTLNQLQPGQAVLVAFEYTPTAAAEMDEIARMLLIDLLGRGVHPVMISTNPTGVLRAYDLIDRLSRDADASRLLKRTEPLVNREDYYVLRYLPGGLVGLRTLVNALYTPGLDALFITDIDGKATNLGADVVEQLRTNPALVLAEGADDVREWAEQYRVTGVTAPASADPAQAEPLRLTLFTSAAASAIAESYAASSTGRITSVLVGVRDAAIYQRLNGLEGSADVARSADERWQSLQLGLLLASFIMLFGMILNAMRGLLRRRGAR